LVSCQKQGTLNPDQKNLHYSHFIYKGDTLSAEYMLINDSVVFTKSIQNSKIDQLLSKENISIFQDNKSSYSYLFDSDKEMIDFSRKQSTRLKSTDTCSTGTYFFLCENKDYGGRVLDFFSSVIESGTGWQGIPDLNYYNFSDIISSFKACSDKTPSTFIVYQDANYGGKSWGFAVNCDLVFDTNLNDNVMINYILYKTYWNDNITSIKRTF
jgi:hypothetical protein